MPSVKCDEARARSLAERVTEPSPFLTYLARRQEVLCDESGQLAVDWRSDEVGDWEHVELDERVLRDGAHVSVIGIWDAAARAIKPAFHRTRLGVSVYRGDARQVLAKQSSIARQLRIAALARFALGAVAVAIPQVIGYDRTSKRLEGEREAASEATGELEAHLDALVDRGDTDGAFSLATQEGPWAVERILRRGFDPNVHLDSGRGHWTLPLVLSHDRETSELLLAAGADPNASASDGSTALHAGVSSGDLGRVEALLARGADMNTVDVDVTTPLDHAVERGDVAVARRLVEAGAPTGCRSDAVCPLTRAARSGSTAMVRLLLEHGAEPGGSPTSHPLEAAREGGFDEIETLLVEALEHRRPWSPIHVQNDP